MGKSGTSNTLLQGKILVVVIMAKAKLRFNYFHIDAVEWFPCRGTWDMGQRHPWWVKKLSGKAQWLMGKWEETRVAIGG